MSEEGVQDASYLLRKLLVTHGQWLGDQYVWVWEHERWREFVFALMAGCSDRSHSDLRDTVEELEELGLLDIAVLAHAIDANHDIAGTKSARRILEILGEEGFGDDEAHRSLQTIGEAARVIRQHYDGKIQFYLRRYGELMLRDATELFRFEHLGEAATRRAFTLWLQNVLCMPVSLNDNALCAFSEAHRLDPAEVIRAADELELNVSILDDLIQQEMAVRALPDGQRE